MIEHLLILAAIFALAIVMNMIGRGSGNFYVPVIIAGGAIMHEAATTGQLILVTRIATALIVYQKYGSSYCSYEIRRL